eukprot:22562-Pelagococcus_subviridis.AAC.3
MAGDECTQRDVNYDGTSRTELQTSKVLTPFTSYAFVSGGMTSVMTKRERREGLGGSARARVQKKSPKTRLERTIGRAVGFRTHQASPACRPPTSCASCTPPRGAWPEEYEKRRARASVDGRKVGSNDQRARSRRGLELIETSGRAT